MIPLSNVTLIDGRVVRSDSEEWRAECEARGVLKLPKAKRMPWIRAVEQRRGEASARKLERDVYRVFNHEKSIIRQSLQNSC
jgi:hypothetical protein